MQSAGTEGQGRNSAEQHEQSWKPLLHDYRDLIGVLTVLTIKLWGDKTIYVMNEYDWQVIVGWWLFGGYTIPKNSWIVMIHYGNPLWESHGIPWNHQPIYKVRLFPISRDPALLWEVGLWSWHGGVARSGRLGSLGFLGEKILVVVQLDRFLRVSSGSTSAPSPKPSLLTLLAASQLHCSVCGQPIQKLASGGWFISTVLRFFEPHKTQLSCKAMCTFRVEQKATACSWHTCDVINRFGDLDLEYRLALHPECYDTIASIN